MRIASETQNPAVHDTESRGELEKLQIDTEMTCRQVNEINNMNLIS